MISDRLEDDFSTIRPRPQLRLSRMPAVNANMTMPLLRVEDAFRRLGTEPPTAAVNDDELTEDEIFAIWVARLI